MWLLSVAEQRNSQRSERTRNTGSISKTVWRVPQTSTYSAVSSRYERQINNGITTATVMTVTPNLLTVTAVGVTRVKSSYGCPCNILTLWIQWPWTHRVTTLRYYGEQAQCPSHKRCYWGRTGYRPRASTGTWPTTGRLLQSSNPEYEPEPIRAGTATPAACSTPTTDVYIPIH